MRIELIRMVRDNDSTEEIYEFCAKHVDENTKLFFDELYHVVLTPVKESRKFFGPILLYGPFCNGQRLASAISKEFGCPVMIDEFSESQIKITVNEYEGETTMKYNVYYVNPHFT